MNNQDFTELRNRNGSDGVWNITSGEDVMQGLSRRLNEAFGMWDEVNITNLQATSSQKITFQATLTKREYCTNPFEIVWKSKGPIEFGTQEEWDGKVRIKTKKIQGEAIVTSGFKSTHGYCPSLMFSSYLRIYWK